MRKRSLAFVGVAVLTGFAFVPAVAAPLVHVSGGLTVVAVGDWVFVKNAGQQRVLERGGGHVRRPGFRSLHTWNKK